LTIGYKCDKFNLINLRRIIMKNCKKIISFALSVIMVLTMTVTMAAPAFASGVQTYPEIYVPGFNTSTIYADKNDPASAVVLPDKETVIQILKDEIAPAFAVYAIDKNAEKLGGVISDVINTVAEGWFNNPDGAAKDNSGANFVYPAKKSIKYNSNLMFGYDWRGDPVESAAQLNDFIDYVLECSGKDKVALTSHSMGSIVVLTYISVYGSDKVMGVVFDSPAIYGLETVGELFSRRTDFDAQGVATILKMLIGTTEYEELLSSIVDIFSMAGINGSISDYLDGAYDRVGSVVFSKSLLPLFGCWPSVWSMIPDEYIEDVMADVFANEFSDEAYAGLKAKIENYNYKVRADKTQTLLDFDAVGRVAVVSRYGYNTIPMTNGWTSLSDAVIDTKNTSFGATTAKIGEHFSDEELSGKDMKYISPDKTIDASTCLFPDKTWFIKNVYHSERDIILEPYYDKLLFASEEATCDNSEVPRFMLYNRENNTVTADESLPQKAEKPTMFTRIFNFIKALINKLLDLFKK
jgi:pimeloyl-ACP methyl ester carboxylesterase